MPTLQPQAFTLDEFEREAAASKALFRAARLSSPATVYGKEFSTYYDLAKDFLVRSADLAEISQSMAALLKSPLDVELLRCLAAAPISEDDLDTLVGSEVAKKRRVSLTPETAVVLGEVIHAALDVWRFPWANENRAATDSERHAACVATACLIAARRTETMRRHEGKNRQEGVVKDLLLREGFVEGPRQVIENLMKAPPLGTFSPECRLAKTKADLVVRLHDGRIMAIECKVSNSEVNSYKRLNHEAAGKAEGWLLEFGRANIVPAAVVGGVFKVSNLSDAQDQGLHLFWEHDLGRLARFLSEAV